MRDQQLEVEFVSPESIAEELGIEQGDIVLRINDQVALDIIDYRFLTTDEEVNILLQKSDGERWLLEIEKDLDEDLGLAFKDGGLGNTKNCRNKCLFCFVDQMPPQMRKSLYVKDDDYRLSFFQGNFVTLTNISDRDLERMAERKLSPLYVSVHTTNPELRVKMMRNPNAGKIMEQLRYLADSGIEIHTQAVLCPGINDGYELDRTLTDLAGLWPSVASLALVPVGLTRYRNKLHSLRTFKNLEAREIVEKVQNWEDFYSEQIGYPLVFASDEFYLLAQKPIPPADLYGDFPQIENGVGLIRIFLDQWMEIQPRLPKELPLKRKIKIITGKLAAPVLSPVVDRLNIIKNLTVELTTVENEFFGTNVTVAGLLTASDILQQIEITGDIDAVILPGAALKSGESVFLDGPSVDYLSRKIGVPVFVAGDPKELARAATALTLK